jgi:Divergent InlB B-repeat domain/Leucine rich repeat N-terminal domain
MKTISFSLKPHQYFLIFSFFILSRWGWTATDCALVTEIPPSECQALLDLYTSTNGPNWTKKDDWNETNTPCSWYGVTCANGNVSQLQLSDNQFSGPIPNSLGNLSQLKKLRLKNNQLCGDIPNTLTSLANLNECNLSSNHLTTSDPNLNQFLDQKCPEWKNQDSPIPDCPTTPTYTLTVGKIGEGTGIIIEPDDTINCGTNCSEEYPAQTIITLFAQADPNFTFMGWEGEDCIKSISSNNTQFDPEITLKITNNLTCAARFDSINFSDHTLTVTKTGSGSGTLTLNIPYKSITCEPTCTQILAHQSEITLQAIPDSDSYLVGFFGQGCASSFSLTQDRNCQARFEKLPIYTLTVTKSGQGNGHITSEIGKLDCGDDCIRSYLSGTTVTLTATPDAGSSFLGWSGDCDSSTTKTSIGIYNNLTCNAEFGIAGIPQLTLDREAVDFAQTRTVVKRTLTIQNIGNGGLRIETIELIDPSIFQISKDNCSNNVLIPNGTCTVTLQFQPPTATVADYQGQLLITSNDPNSPTSVALQGQGCSDDDAYQRQVSIEPYRLDFGVVTVGHTTTRQQRIDMWSQGCGFLDLDTITLKGRHVDEFTLLEKDCYYGTWQGRNHASCWFTTEFHPTSVGLKEIRAVITYTDPTLEMSPYRWNAEAISDGKPQLELSETEHDFGTITLGEEPPSWSLTLTNSGTANLAFEQMSIDQAEFKLYDSECTLIAPQQSCQLWVQLTPIALGDKLAQLTLVYAGTTVQIPLKAAIIGPTACSPEQITIATTGQSPLWENPAAWQRLQEGPKIPSTNDVVRINSAHVMVGLPLLQVKALCIENQAILLSRDDQGTALEIQATDYFQNQGHVLGLNGASNRRETCTTNCAKPGASVIIKVGSQFEQQSKLGNFWWYGSGGPILNSGEIKAGNGASSLNYGAAGGDVLVLGRNTTNLGLIQAGQGGHVLGTGAGQAGAGGLTQIWGNLGGAGHLYNQNGAQAIAGDGGKCNPAATEPQIGGNGGNLWLVSLPEVYLNDGIYRAGQGSHNCHSNGTDGFVRIEPSIIDLAGAHTHVNGGNITIFGGKDWILNLRNTAGELLEATGDITLATGPGGIIDLRDNNTILLKAAGQVNLFADTILLNNGVILADLIEAKAIVVGPNKILQDVALVGNGSIFAQPQTLMPLTFTLSNNGPQADTYLLKVTDLAGWPLSFTEQPVSVAGLTHLIVTPQVTLPQTVGTTNVITMTAISQTDPNVKATAQISVTVTNQAPLVTTATLQTFLTENQLTNTIPPLDNLPELNNLVPTTSQQDSATVGETLIDSHQEIIAADGSYSITAPHSTLAPTVMDFTLMDSFPCPVNTHFIDWPCDNHNQTLQDVNFGAQASVAGGILAGVIHNEGWLSQLTIAPAAQVTGGKLTGDINNQGTLIDIQFVGRQVHGGTLQGVIANQSQIGGTFMDVILADNTVLSGGAVAGQITGHCLAPARLESLTVLPGSHLECVILGKGVTLTGDVTLQNVQIAVSPAALQIIDSADLITLPNLEATATDEQAQSQPTQAILAGGAAINGAQFQQHTEMTATDWVKVYGQIQAEPAHMNQPVEIVVYGRYESQSSETQPVDFMLINTENRGKPQVKPWNGQLANLVAFETLAAIPDHYLVPLYEDLLTVAAGRMEIFFGYRIINAAGKSIVIHNQTGIEIVIR